jgi:hypothetical protein
MIYFNVPMTSHEFWWMLSIDIRFLIFLFFWHKGRQASLRKEKGTQPKNGPKGSKLNGGENLPPNDT